MRARYLRYRREIYCGIFLFIAAITANAGTWRSHEAMSAPENYIFGYGSLMNTASRQSTLENNTPTIPVRISASFGYLRGWNARIKSGFTALSVRKPSESEKPSTINGVIYPVAEKDLPLFDKREADYKRIEIPRALLERASWLEVPTKGKFWIYITDNASGNQSNVPDANYPLLQSYIDTVLKGTLEYGAAFSEEFIETTVDWNRFWLNDREYARRPWVHEKKYALIDSLLQDTPPSARFFQERVYSEVYAARYFKRINTDFGPDAP